MKIKWNCVLIFAYYGEYIFLFFHSLDAVVPYLCALCTKFKLKKTSISSSSFETYCFFIYVFKYLFTNSYKLLKFCKLPIDKQVDNSINYVFLYTTFDV